MFFFFPVEHRCFIEYAQIRSLAQHRSRIMPFIMRRPYFDDDSTPRIELIILIADDRFRKPTRGHNVTILRDRRTICFVR